MLLSKLVTLGVRVEDVTLSIELNPYSYTFYDFISYLRIEG